jgi:pimeloyl-ACP methyl ester carboxylesterase
VIACARGAAREARAVARGDPTRWSGWAGWPPRATVTPPLADDDPPAAAGTRLGRYVLEERLGVGGMAEVYRARAGGAFGFELPVAIKWIKPGIGERREVIAMFVSEARISTRLRHPNIVAVTDFARDDRGRLYLVMELVDGVDLATLAATGPLPAAAIIHVATELARGLGFAHELPDAGDGVRGVIHRDVSPQNTLLSWHGAVKVSDFGIAKLRAATMASATAHLTGKPAYMSPEQARGLPLDGRSDLFAVGVMMWELACGRRLFGGAGGPRESLARLLYAPIADPRRARPELADDLAAVIMRCLSRPAAGRPARARELIALLRECRDAPADGAATLAAVLAERCSEHAPAAAIRALQQASTVTRGVARGWYHRAVPTTSMVSLEAWRAAGETIRWRGHDVFVRTDGAGDALLLIHGFPTASWDWWPLWQPLAARYRLVTCDLLGYGFSAKPRPHAYRIADQAELLLAVLAHAGIASGSGRCRVVAHDYGATVAQELLARRREGSLPVTLDGVCLLNGGLFPEAHRALRTQKLLASRLGPLLARFTGKRRFVASMRAIWGERPPPAGELDAMWTLVSQGGGARVLPALLDYLAQRRANRARWVGALADPALAAGPARLPVRFICGLADPISGAHMAARYRELVPSPDVVELAGVGHYPQLEAPEAVLAAVLERFAAAAD